MIYFVDRAPNKITSSTFIPLLILTSNTQNLHNSYFGRLPALSPHFAPGQFLEARLVLRISHDPKPQTDRKVRQHLEYICVAPKLPRPRPPRLSTRAESWITAAQAMVIRRAACSLSEDNVNKQSNMEKSTVGSNPCLLFVHSLSVPSIPSLSQGQNAAQFSNQSFRANYEQSYYFGTANNDYWVRWKQMHYLMNLPEPNMRKRAIPIDTISAVTTPTVTNAADKE